MSGHWFWIGLFLLGAYHGLNPAMGWLFAVALGMQEKSSRAVARAMLPLAAGHLLSVGVVVLAVQLILIRVPLFALRVTGALTLIGFGIFRLVRNRHPRWVGMRVGARDLVAWSFLMASAHGAGLMLIPFLLAGAGTAAPMDHSHHLAMLAAAPAADAAVRLQPWLVVVLHTFGYLSVTAALAWLVYRKFGVAFLQRGWFNLDLLWAAALIATGLITILF
jgi:hypothetical protein